jgi:hypothetical protein
VPGRSTRADDDVEVDCGERRKTQPWPLKVHGGDGTGDGSIMFGKHRQMAAVGLACQEKGINRHDGLGGGVGLEPKSSQFDAQIKTLNVL